MPFSLLRSDQNAFSFVVTLPVTGPICRSGSLCATGDDLLEHGTVIDTAPVIAERVLTCVFGQILNLPFVVLADVTATDPSVKGLALVDARAGFGVHILAFRMIDTLNVVKVAVQEV